MLEFFRARPAAWPILFSLIFCTIIAFFSVTNRPLFPVDETRYLTVAWEMFSRNDWLLPTLNGEAYHHKPPLLFWIIMTLWSVFGVSENAALLTAPLIAALVCVMTIRLSRVMAPENPRLPLLAACMTLGSLAFVLYSVMIMFDMLLSVFVVLGLTAIWQFARTGHWKHIVLFALAVGLGALAKGPVILLHLLFPVVLIRLWRPADAAPISTARWAGSFTAGVLLGTILGLCWAIPAAISGGPEFTEKIFWGQTAGRMTQSFDHQHPIWWYLPFIPAFLMPWLLHGGLWKGLKSLKGETGESRSQLRFLLLCWIVPAFISFSLISGKQVHYLLPLVPGIGLVFALGFDRARDRITRTQALPAVLLCAGLAALPAMANLLAPYIEARNPDNIHLANTLRQMSIPVSLACSGLILALGLTQLRRGLLAQATVISLSMLIFVSCFVVEAGRGYFKNYDLKPIAAIIRQYPDAPLAFVRNYHGEWGFLARLENRTVKQIDQPHMQAWFRDNPNGLMFIRTSRAHEYADFDVIYSQPYKMSSTYALLAPKGKAKTFPYIKP